MMGNQNTGSKDVQSTIEDLKASLTKAELCANQAELREKALLDSNEEARKFLRQRVILNEKLAELQEENEIMAKSLDEEERAYGISTNGNMWRFWSMKARELADANVKLRAERDEANAQVIALKEAHAEQERYLHEAEVAKQTLCVMQKALTDVCSDLFYQIESKFGPKAASEYPSIAKARELLATLK